MGRGYNDYYLVSYPKSGNTWVRFLLANYLYPNEEVDFHSIHRLIPELGTQNIWVQDDKIRPLYKSHDPFRSDFTNVIYIARDGRDVYTSYYHYRKNQLPENMSFSDFLSSDRYKPCGWGSHVNSWLTRSDKLKRFLLIHYEDLIKDTASELEKILNFIGLKSLNRKRVDKAVEASSFNRMKQLEQKHGRAYADEDKANRFMRKGRVNDWQSMFGERDKEIFKNSIDGKMLISLGYEEDNSW